MKRIFLIVAASLCMASLHAADRFYIAATINGKPATFEFDTGCTSSFLYSDKARRLGLTNLLGSYEYYSRTTEPCMVSIGKATCTMWFGVADVRDPSFLIGIEDGILGWKTLRNSVLQLDAEIGLITPLDKLPVGVNSWITLPFLENWPSLGFKIPAGQQRLRKANILIDTGKFAGVSLPPRCWESWRKANMNQPVTLDCYVSAIYGTSIVEESWADALTLGTFCLTDTPVMQDDSHVLERVPTNYEGTLGMAALSRLDIILDGPHGFAYVRLKRPPAPAYEHNRIGAVFAPRDEQSDDLLAHVLTNSPAYISGIRDGDLLLKVDGNSVTNWRNDGALSSSASDPPGSKTAYTLKRGSKTFTNIVISKQILGPEYRTPRAPRTNDFSNMTIHINSNDADDYYERAKVYYQSNDFEKAAADLTEAIRLDPTNATIFYFRGLCYSRMDNVDLGIGDLTKTLQIDPTYAEAYLVRGEAYMHKFDATNGIEDLTQAIRLNSKLALAYQCRGFLYSTQGRFVEAAQDYSKAVALDPKDSWSYSALALVKATCTDNSVRNGQEAVTDAKKACELTGWSERNSIQALAAAYAETGDFKHAIEYENQALRVGKPTDADLRSAEEHISLFERSQPVRYSRPTGEGVVQGSSPYDEGRFYINAKINGKPANFIFDTCTYESIIWSNRLGRLGLTNLLGGYSAFNATTEPCNVSIGAVTCRMWFGVMNLPQDITTPADGSLGWKTLRNNILQLDAEANLLTLLDKVPNAAKSWMRVPWPSVSPVLKLEIQDQQQMKMAIFIDTGDENGISLPPHGWEVWRAANPNQIFTHITTFNPVFGTATLEESWAKVFNFGPLRITDTPVMQAGPAEIAAGSTNYEGTLGMAALKHLDIILDGTRNEAYIRPRLSPASPNPRKPKTNDFSKVAIHINSNDGEDYFRRASAYYAKNEFNLASADFTEAISNLTEFLRVNPTNALALLERGFAYGQFDAKKGIEDLTKAVALDPMLDRAYKARGFLYSNRGQFVEAVHDYGKAIDLNPRDWQTLSALARLMATCSDASIRNGREGVIAAKKACELTDWKNPEPIRTLAAACAEAGDFKNAIAYEKQALSAGEPTSSTSTIEIGTNIFKKQLLRPRVPTYSEAQSANERISLYELSKPIRDTPPH